MKKEALEIHRQEAAASQATETENIEKCPFAHNGEGSVENADTDATMTTNDAFESNGVVPASTIAIGDKPVGLGSFKVAKIETVKENLETQSLTVQQISDYCKSLFIFKSIRVMRFKLVHKIIVHRGSHANLPKISSSITAFSGRGRREENSPKIKST